MTTTPRAFAVLLAQSVAAAALAIAHMLYNFRVGYLLYGLSGGIRPAGSGWTEYGGAPFAWTIPLEMPGVWLQDVGLGPLAVIWLLAASLVVGYAVVAAVVRLRRGGRLLARKWQIAILILGLIWIAVPETWSLVYQYTVRF